MLIREELEALEHQVLNPLAAFADASKGRRAAEKPDEIRTCYMRDRDRIIHSKSFRRLKHKTQVFIAQGNDHYRTRLTHTLEVNQISQTIGKALRLNTDLIEAIALGHDVGHTPFAHTGEEVLNRLVPGGFKHNVNSIRVLTKIEQGSLGNGLNLSAEVLDGILQHSGFGKDTSGCMTLEGQVVHYADKIAYVQHDIDDSIRAGVLALQDIPREYLDILGKTHGERIGTLVQDLAVTSRKNLAAGEKKISLSPSIEQALLGLRKFMFSAVYRGPLCMEERQGAAHIVEFLFEYYRKRPEELPDFYRCLAEEDGTERGVADYISGMTDNYCMSAFKNIVLPRHYI
ncbi:MAG: deoxyguanosinetriphosphate triphosphohydrolase [Clostridia bacterium]|jgi:dGTPase|nr:deoxyguanosinetriphosphate triphosphohydrolase [Clostridia bacterium]